MKSGKNKNNNMENTSDFAVVIPAYNEEASIVNTIKETVKVLDSFDSDYEVLVVDDGSTDSTNGEVRNFLGSNNSKVSLQSYNPNQGKGFALKYGFGFLKSKYVMFLDADLDLHPSHLIDMYRIMDKYNADVVIGSKKHEKSEINYPRSRKILSNAYYFFVRSLFRLPVRDTQTGIKLFKYKALYDCMPSIVVRRYAFDLELLLAIYRKGFKIVEAPIQLITKREFGRIGISDAFRVFADTARIFWRFYIRKDYG